MRRPRITISGLLGFVAFLAVALAALRGANDAWDAALLGLTLLVMLTSVLLAVHRNGETRAFWLGFAVFGWAYLVLSLVPAVESRLPTRKALVAGWEMMPVPEDADDYITFTTSPGVGMNLAPTGSPAAPSPAGGWDVVVYNSPTTTSPRSFTRRISGLPGDAAGNFVRIGHSLLALVVASFGACLSRRLNGLGRSDRPEEPAAQSPSPLR